MADAMKGLNISSTTVLVDPTDFYRHLQGPKYIFAVVVCWVSALFSTFGAGTIVYLIIRQRKYKSVLFQRLMLGMCLADLLASTQVFTHFFCLPAWTETPFARGNTHSCSFIAVLFFLQNASNMYSCQLSVYFLLMIRYRWSERKMVKTFEPWIHILPWIIPFITISFALATKAFNPLHIFGVCGIFQYPPDCRVNDQVDCERGGHFLQDPFDFIYYGSSMIFAIAGAVCTWAMFRHVQCIGQQGSARAMNQKMVYMRTRAFTRLVFFFILFGFVAGVVIEANDFYGAPDNPVIIYLIYLVYFLYPIQGFLNFLVYMRPTVVRWKDVHPEKSVGWCFYQILQGHSTPTTSRTAHLKFPNEKDKTSTDTAATTADATKNRREEEDNVDISATAEAYGEEKEDDMCSSVRQRHGEKEDIISPPPGMIHNEDASSDDQEKHFDDAVEKDNGEKQEGNAYGEAVVVVDDKIGSRLDI